MTTSLSRRPPLAPTPSPGDTAAWAAWVEAHPASRALGLECLDVSRGRIVTRAQRSIWPSGTDGSLPDGMVLACADQCLGLVAMTAVEPGSVPATASLTAELLRPPHPPITLTATVEKSGRTLSFITVDVHDREGRLCARVAGTMATQGNTRHERTHQEAHHADAES